jgi:hypothetical protein
VQHERSRRASPLRARSARVLPAPAARPSAQRCATPCPVCLRLPRAAARPAARTFFFSASRRSSACRAASAMTGLAPNTTDGLVGVGSRLSCRAPAFCEGAAACGGVRLALRESLDLLRDTLPAFLPVCQSVCGSPSGSHPISCATRCLRFCLSACGSPSGSRPIACARRCLRFCLSTCVTRCRVLRHALPSSPHTYLPFYLVYLRVYMCQPTRGPHCEVVLCQASCSAHL